MCAREDAGDREWIRLQAAMDELARLRARLSRFRENHRASTARANARWEAKLQRRVKHLEAKYGIRAPESLQACMGSGGGLSPAERRACRLLDVTEESFLSVKYPMPVSDGTGEHARRGAGSETNQGLA